MVKKSVEILDTTLRDGTQGANISFTLNDKVRIALELDELGVDYIEGGWPGSNPKDEEFFKVIKNYSLTKSKIAAFGSTRKKDLRVDEDPSIDSIIKSDVNVAVIFGKSWILHVREVLKATEQENLEMVYDTIAYLKSHGMQVIFDAEHFYQGYKDNPDYALSVVRTAESAGANVVVLADTNGGTLPFEIYEITKNVVDKLKVKVGLHMHNDAGCAVANTLMGVKAGARHVQGTINGIGERTGNADLLQIIPSLALKMGFKVLNGSESLKRLRKVSKLVCELAGIQYNPYQPYIGEYAFCHKAGVHVDAVMKVPRAYEHIDPSLVGNERKFVISELSGTSNLYAYLLNLGINLDKKDARLKRALDKIKILEKVGYSFDTGPASAVLIALKELGYYNKFIDVNYWKVITEENGTAIAVVKVNSKLEVSEGVGPVHAVDKAIRSVLLTMFPELYNVKLVDYRVILPGEIKNTESVVRVTIEFSDGKNNWKTEGVSTNIIDASVKALIDGLDYYLQINRVLKLS